MVSPKLDRRRVHVEHGLTADEPCSGAQAIRMKSRTPSWPAALGLLAAVLFNGCAGLGPPAAAPAPVPAHVRLPNPASLACIQAGGQSRIVRQVDGSEAGLCVWPSGRSCDEWAFYRAECKP